MISDYTCDNCKKTPAFRAGVCGGCGKRANLCAPCFHVYISCSEECRIRWRAEAARGLPSEKLPIPLDARPVKPKGISVHQSDLFKKS